MNVTDRLVLEYSELSDGYTAAGELCPVCGGGSSKERTLSVTRRESRLYWKCHRASCAFSGSDAVGFITRTSHQPVSCRGTVGRTIIRQSDSVPETFRQYLQQKYCITEQHISKYQLGWDTDTNRLCLPVFSPAREVLGVNLRSLSGQQPKAKLHVETGAIAWYTNHVTPGIIIVEDQFSAIRASDYLSSVALLGAHINEDNVYEIKKQAGRQPVYLALDADAWDKAVRCAVKFRSILPMQLLRLAKDLKDHNEEELKEFMDNVQH